jgi:hypothetical protein
MRFYGPLRSLHLRALRSDSSPLTPLEKAIVAVNAAMGIGLIAYAVYRLVVGVTFLSL